MKDSKVPGGKQTHSTEAQVILKSVTLNTRPMMPLNTGYLSWQQSNLSGYLSIDMIKKIKLKSVISHGHILDI